MNPETKILTAVPGCFILLWLTNWSLGHGHEYGGDFSAASILLAALAIMLLQLLVRAEAVHADKGQGERAVRTLAAPGATRL